MSGYAEAIMDAGSRAAGGMARRDLAGARRVFALVTAEFLPASLLTPMARSLDVSEALAGQAVTATAVVAFFAGLAGRRRHARASTAAWSSWGFRRF